MDNTGPYVSKAQLLAEIANAEKATAKAISLANQSGSNFEYSGAGVPVVGDWIVQGAVSTTVTALLSTPSRLTVADPTGLTNGEATLYHPTTPQSAAALDAIIALSMAFVDRITRQWFNARALSVKIEGTNSDLMLLGVPILTLTSVVFNEEQTFSTTDEINNYFLYPNARGYPDDRKNPKIKLRRDVRNVFLDTGRGQIFRRGRMQVFAGTFGYLEEDGTTPLLIQRATLKYAVIKYIDPPGTSAADSSVEKGPMKREKTDLHEIEYFDPSKSGAATAAGAKGLAPLSGDREIDDILLMYRGPLLMAGSFLDEGVEAPRFNGGFN